MNAFLSVRGRVCPHAQLFPATGTDKLGHPVYYEKPGVVDPKELFKAVTTERVMQFHVQV